MVSSVLLLHSSVAIGMMGDNGDLAMAEMGGDDEVMNGEAEAAKVAALPRWWFRWWSVESSAGWVSWGWRWRYPPRNGGGGCRVVLLSVGGETRW
ncbi:hypothetical protein Dimus_012791 [Dionaea muscipula]